MTRDEKENLKARYNVTKRLYKSLLEDIKNIPRDTRDYYEVSGELMILRMQIADIRSTLLEATFGRFYPTAILENFILGNEENVRGGR